MVSADLPRNNLLVVDDEDMVLKLMRDSLEREDAYNCFFADSGIKALEIVGSEKIDVVLTDVKMPGMSGIELMGKVREISTGTAFIIMSGYSGIEDVIAALRQGAIDFFQKPFDLRTIMDCLRRTFSRLNQEYSRQEALSFMVEENRLFRIPNDFNAANQVTLDLAKNLVERGYAEEGVVESVRVALNEMVINSIEHGNLEVDYEQKNQLIDNFENYNKFLVERSQADIYSGRTVEIENQTTPEAIRFIVRDQGNGFDHTDLLDPTDPANLMTCHGRGILMARIYMDEVVYNEKGNEVTLTKFRTPAGDA